MWKTGEDAHANIVETDRTVEVEAAGGGVTELPKVGRSLALI